MDYKQFLKEVIKEAENVQKAPHLGIYEITERAFKSEIGKKFLDDIAKKRIKIKDAKIDVFFNDFEKKDEIIWKDGVWEYGTWEDGWWYGGVWLDGIWKNGIWKKGKWFDGVWENGVWKDGEWHDGKWIKGTWIKGKIYSKKNKLEASAVSPDKFKTKDKDIDESE